MVSCAFIIIIRKLEHKCNVETYRLRLSFNFFLMKNLALQNTYKRYLGELLRLMAKTSKMKEAVSGSHLHILEE